MICFAISLKNLNSIQNRITVKLFVISVIRFSTLTNNVFVNQLLTIDVNTKGMFTSDTLLMSIIL